MILINQLVYVVIGPSSFRAATFPSTRGRHRVGVSVGVRRDGRHGTSVSLSRRVVTHHLSARTDRFFVCGVCVFIYARTHVLDHRYRPSRRALSHARVVHPPPRWKDDGDGDDTRRRERRRREGAETREDERTVSIESARACADRIDRIERIERIERIHRIHRSDG